MALQSQAEYQLEQVQNGDVDAESLGRLDRAELKYVLGEATGAFSLDGDEVYGDERGDGAMTKDEVVAVILSLESNGSGE